MGNLNCSKCCQGIEQKEEFDMKPSVLLPSYMNTKETLQFESQPKVEKSSKLQELSAIKIQSIWKCYHYRKQFIHLKKITQLNYIYFSTEEIHQTLSSALLSDNPEVRPKYTYPSGSTYEGSWLGGFRHGYGVMKWYDGCRYEGYWDFSYAFGEGKFTHTDNDIFEGPWKCPYETGRQPFSSNSRSFLESIQKGKKDGYLWLWYKQEIIDQQNHKERSSIFSLRHIKRTKDLIRKYNQLQVQLDYPREMLNKLIEELKYKKSIKLTSGVKYIGDWKDNKRDGKGKNIWENEDIYEGEWKNDMQNGWGKNVWIDGSMYIGQYKNNLKEGIGEYCWEDGTSYLGEWKDNCINGIGRYTWEDGRDYLGEWVNGAMQGFGIFTWKDGKKYEGGWHRGKKHGEGYTIWPDGRVCRDFWEHNRNIEKFC
ncbi:unnamed protein product [Blepharisma stoltei]|uniref:MORN repeat protein n=1 Tax=Blepharisma stoltei TaxID=1481888 RepID=A0AAU9JGW0_9CILI|nr:unnamed protein product [Blepharisma stoltei]